LPRVQSALPPPRRRATRRSRTPAARTPAYRASCRLASVGGSFKLNFGYTPVVRARGSEGCPTAPLSDSQVQINYIRIQTERKQSHRSALSVAKASTQSAVSCHRRWQDSMSSACVTT
jgi:hypothetical protein